MFVFLGVAGFAGGLVVAGGVDGEFAEEFAGGGVDDADFEVLDEFQDGGSGEGSAHADVVESAVDAQGEFAVGVDSVGQHAFVGVAVVCARGGFGARVVGGGWGGVVGQGEPPR